MNKLDRRRKKRWDQLRKEEDLTTVKESLGEQNLSYKPISAVQPDAMPETFGRGRSVTKQMADLLIYKQDLSVLSEGDADDLNQKTHHNADNGSIR